MKIRVNIMVVKLGMGNYHVAIYPRRGRQAYRSHYDWKAGDVISKLGLSDERGQSILAAVEIHRYYFLADFELVKEQAEAFKLKA